MFFVVAGLIFGAGLLIPLSLAMLIFVLITAIVDRVGRWQISGKRVPDWIAYLISLGLVTFVFLGMASILSSQAAAVAEAFPTYEQRFSKVLGRLSALVGRENYNAAIEAVSNLDVSELAGSVISSAGAFLTAFFLVLLYIPFMLLERSAMRKKLKIIAPDKNTHLKLVAILDNMSASLQRYIGIKTLVSLITAAGSYAFMKPIGLDFAETWAVLAFSLNFIPTIGSIIGVALPAIVALAQFDTVSPFLIILFGCGAVQFIVGNILEPALTGRTLNLSPLMVILSLTFWTTIWGMAGALLSVPITVCLLIVMSYIPSTRFIAILMSGDGKLTTDQLMETVNEEE